MIIYYASRRGGYWLVDTSGTGDIGDIGGTMDPMEATQYASKRECNRVIAACAKKWRVEKALFHRFKAA